MEVQFKARSLWKSAKELTVKCAKSLSNGLSFEEVFTLYIVYFRCVIPSAVENFVDYLAAFLLFHLYLGYVLVFAVSLAVFKKFKTKGSGIAPITGALKEKAGVVLTYFFVVQSISKFTFGLAALDRVMGWAFQIKPAINFKPQIKIGKSKSNESVVSVKSKVDTSLNVGFESEDESTRKSIKKLGKVKRNVEFVSEMADAMMGQEDTGEEEWSDTYKSNLLLEAPDPEADSSCLVQKWLADSESADADVIKKHVMRLMAENDEMRRRSFVCKPQQKQ